MGARGVHMGAAMISDSGGTTIHESMKTCKTRKQRDSGGGDKLVKSIDRT